MISFLICAVILQTVVLLAFAAILLGLARQIGVLHERVAPMGAMTNDHGPEVGESAPTMSIQTIQGSLTQIGGPSTDNKSRLLLFVSPSCPVCKKLLPIAKSFAKGERLTVTLVGDGSQQDQIQMIEENRLETMTYVNSPQVGMAFHVGKLPYAILIDADGVIRAKGLVNNREHLESLVIAEETGFGSIQSYLKAKGYVSDNHSHADAH
jgi:methylamine dehydrogenase accessory protein MauD